MGDPAPAGAKAESSGFTIELNLTGEHAFRADIDDTPGDVAVWRAGFGIDLSTRWGERARLGLGIEEEASWYLFDNARGLVPGAPADGDPFEQVLITRLLPRLSVQHDERWAWFLGGIVEFAGEPGADVGDSATFGGFAGARYAFSENFSLSFGLGAKSRLEDSALVIPLLGVEWKVNDTVTLSSEGTKLRLAAKLSEQLTVALQGGWELREFRLDDDNVLPEGVVRDSRIPIGVSLDWKPCPRAAISLTGGAIIWQEFRFDDRNGDRVSETNTDPTPYIGLSGRITF